VAPSVLAADWSRIAAEVDEVAAAGADLLHLDVMDGQFVDNITMGPVIIRGLRRLTSLYLDAHLMVLEPGRYAAAFRDAGCDGITVHAEATEDLPGTLEAVRRTGAHVGMSLNPGTPLEPYAAHLERLDLLLLMSVQPGHGGQSFRPEVLPKVAQAARLRQQRGLRFAIEIDGGIDAQTAGPARQAGVDVLVAGTAIFRERPYAARIAAIRAAADPDSP
jgi:ribulose-phosphate 3-epimerase